MEITEEQAAEYEALRDEHARREEARAKAEEEAAAKITAPTHHVILADGTAIQGSQIGTHHSNGDGTGDVAGDQVVPVAAAYPIN